MTAARNVITCPGVGDDGDHVKSVGMSTAAALTPGATATAIAASAVVAASEIRRTDERAKAESTQTKRARRAGLRGWRAAG